jgi:hypothetical protein
MDWRFRQAVEEQGVLMQTRSHFLGTVFLAALLLLLSACSVNVKKDEGGDKKNVDIETPFGGIHVNENADVRDTGLPVYPGARPKPKDDSDDRKNANVNISAGNFGLRVVALDFETDDPPAKVQSFYQEQLKKYGAVLQCHTSEHGASYKAHPGKDNSDQLNCDGEKNGKNIELKVGTESNQHIVSIEPRDKGTEFALVYVRTHGKEGSI